MKREVFSIVCTGLIFFILCVASIVKIVYPSPVLKDFYFIIGVFELLLGAGVLIFSHRWETWALLALIFTAWGGYSLYSTIFGLPCSCLGAVVTLPRGVSFSVNCLVAGSSWALLLGSPLASKTFSWMRLFSIVLFFTGFAVAKIIYNVNL